MIAVPDEFRAAEGMHVRETVATKRSVGVVNSHHVDVAA
jgi:hypothetical protein